MSDRKLACLAAIFLGLCLSSVCAQNTTDAPYIKEISVKTAGNPIAWLNDAVYFTLTFDRNVSIYCPAEESSCFSFTLACPKARVVADLSASASYSAQQLSFTYIVASGDNCDHIQFKNTSHVKIDVADAEIVGIPDNIPAKLTLPSPPPPEKLPQISTVVPRIQTITTATKSGTYGAGKIIRIAVVFTEPVEIELNGGSPPTLDLSSRGSATFSAADRNDPSIQFFKYIVKDGEDTAGQYLNVLDDQALDLGAASIYSIESSIDAVLTTPLDSLNVSKITIRTSTKAFPPLGYDRSQNPRGAEGSATTVSVMHEVHGIYDLKEKDQSFKIDFTCITTWDDPSFNSTEYTEFPISILDQIWSPRLTFGNLRDQGQLLIQRVVISRGRCEIWQRWLITLGFLVDAKNFPFDTQRLVIRQQSIQYNSSVVDFRLIQNTANFTKFDTHLRSLKDPTFEFSNLTQHTEVANDGASVGIERLFTTITATRQTTLSTMNLIFPITMLMLSSYFTFWMNLKTDSRLTSATAAIIGTMTFSQTVSNALPAVGRATKMSNFILFSYIFTFTVLICQVFIRSIYFIGYELKRDLKKDDKKDKGIGQASPAAGAKKKSKPGGAEGSLPPSASSSFKSDTGFALSSFPVDGEEEEAEEDDEGRSSPSIFDPSLDGEERSKQKRPSTSINADDEDHQPLLPTKGDEEETNPADMVYTFAWCIKIHKGNLRRVFNNLETTNFALRIIMFVVLALSVALIIAL